MIAKGEEIEIDEAALKSIARLANGGMRDAQSTLDQLISFCGKTITDKDVLEVYGLASRKEIHHLASLLAQGNYPKILAAVDQLADSGKDLYRVLIDLQAYLRELLLDGIRSSGETDRLGLPLTVESLMRMNDALHRGKDDVKMGLSQTVNFEVTLLRAVEQSRTRSIDTLIKEISGMARKAPSSPDQPKTVEPVREQGYSGPPLQADRVQEETRFSTDSSARKRENSQAVEEAVKTLPKAIQGAMDDLFRVQYTHVGSLPPPPRS